MDGYQVLQIMPATNVTYAMFGDPQNLFQFKVKVWALIETKLQKKVIGMVSIGSFSGLLCIDEVENKYADDYGSFIGYSDEANNE